MTRDDVLKILREARDKNASEIHFKVPNRPLFRIDGVLLPVGQVQLTPQGSLQIAQHLCALANLEVPLNTATDREFSFGVNGVGRFFVSLYRQRGSTAIIVQRSELTIPALTSLGFDADVERILGNPGLILCTGVRKRAMLVASLVDRFNAAHRGFVTILEDPITYLHRDAMATIAQRGVNTDTESMAAGIRAALRQHPDLLAIGELRDRISLDGALDAVDHGINVIGGVTVPNPHEAISALARHYPLAERSDVETRLKRSIRGILSLSDNGQAVFVAVEANE